jgi:hypothetical protein
MGPDLCHHSWAVIAITNTGLPPEWREGRRKYEGGIEGNGMEQETPLLLTVDERNKWKKRW